MIQLTIIKITGYGPWTLTLGDDREHQLQILQASLYKELQTLFSKKNCLLFLNRSDEFFVVTNGIGLDDHIDIQKKLQSMFDIKLSMSIGYGKTPSEANIKAYKGKRSDVILNKEYSIYGYILNKEHDITNEHIIIMHLDVDDLTSKRETNSPYEVSLLIFDLYAKMSKFFFEKDSLTFFMGGDNFMMVTSEQAKNSVKEFLDDIRIRDGIMINCGVGIGRNAREAAKLATRSLDTIRKIRDDGKVKEVPKVYEISCF